jgi:hypothetical protein
MSKLVVVVLLEFDGIESADSNDAEMVIDEVSNEVQKLVLSDWQSAPTTVTGWVDDAWVNREDAPVKGTVQAEWRAQS